MIIVGTISHVSAFAVVTRDMVEKEVVVETDLIKTADNFIVWFDTSGSSNEMDTPKRNCDYARARNF